mmetsp:Transcript_36996/g.67473  ORF Transcript_36996/g.67473 Transcript_36996/m.67473 type:complete len:84 (+) Transcript_36996:38-289(+)
MLLEMAAGIGATFKATNSDNHSDSMFRESVTRFFSKRSAHMSALTCMGAEKNELLVKMLDELLQVDPMMRADMSKIVTMAESI